MSFVKVSVVCTVFAAESIPVATTVRELLVPCVHEKEFETYGPPLGAELVAIVCDQPVLAGPAVDVIW
jgi:hypothetical protein